MQFLPLIILTGLFYGIYNFFIKVSSGHINQIVGAVILQIVAALLGVFILIYLKYTGQPLDITNKGVYLAALAGIFVGLAEITSFVIFSKGVDLSSALAIIVGITVISGALLGVLVLKESINTLVIIGTILTIAGIALITYAK